MCNPSPGRILRNVKRITKFIERKRKSKPVLCVTILDQIDIYPTSQKVLTACNLPNLSIEAKRKHLSRRTFQQINILPGAGFDDDIIMSKLRPYCPECDKTYKREEVLLFRDHCRVMHDWLWCENWYRGKGCEFATTLYEEMQEHLDSCNSKLMELVSAK